jgi:hypothetical protein
MMFKTDQIVDIMIRTGYSNKSINYVNELNGKEIDINQLQTNDRLKYEGWLRLRYKA